MVFMLDDTGNDVATVPANHPCQTDPVLDCTKLGITAAGFQAQKEYMKAMINYFDVSPAATRIALITFNDVPTVQFDYTDVSADLIALIDAVPYTGSSHVRDTAAAMDGAMTLGFSNSRSLQTMRRKYAPEYFVQNQRSQRIQPTLRGRVDVQDVGIVITGGPECNNYGTCTGGFWADLSLMAMIWSDPSSSNGAPVFAIGSRDQSEQGPSQAELTTIALGDVNTVFETMTYDFTGLDSVAASGVCGSAGTGFITN